MLPFDALLCGGCQFGRQCSFTLHPAQELVRLRVLCVKLWRGQAQCFEALQFHFDRSVGNLFRIKLLLKVAVQAKSAHALYVAGTRAKA